ncbi:MAG: arginase family protein [Candidatus Obscuribacterales bacterium]|nr:arginase family protein [Candidatus Obscuribacterales bacterium]
MQEPEKRYFNLPEEYSNPEKAKVAIVPVPFDRSPDESNNSSSGPEAILAASQDLELFDEELWVEPGKIGIETLSPITLEAPTEETKKPFEPLTEIVASLIKKEKFPIVLGGEHSISLASVAACIKQHKDLSILQIDARPDLTVPKNGSPFKLDSVGYNLYKMLPKPNVTQVGIRNLNSDEAEWMEKKEPDINIFWARHQDRWNINEILGSLSDNVYLTIDVGALDSALMPATKYPEPGGMSWYTLMEIIKHLCVRKNVVAADVVEFVPLEGLRAPSILVAKMIYKLIGYRFALDLGVTKKYL